MFIQGETTVFQALPITGGRPGIQDVANNRERFILVSPIGSSLLSGVQVSAVSTGSNEAATADKGSIESATPERSNTTHSLSSLAHQLSDSATRAAQRDSSLSRKELGAKANELLGQIAGDGYFANKKINDAQVPDTEDPVLLERARNATQFVNGSGKNPFAGLSKEQLSLVIYDDSGSFTANERRAAWSESSDQEYAWRQKAVASSMAEYDRTGKLTQFFTDALEHYRTLPAVEQAQYPNSYEAKLKGWIALDFNYRTHTVEGKGSPQAVMDKVLSLDKNMFDEDESSSAV